MNDDQRQWTPHVTDARPWHIIAVALDLCEEDAAEFALMGLDTRDALEDFAVRRALRPGPKFTFMSAEGKPIGCIGIDDDGMMEGLGTLWLIKRNGWKKNRYIKMCIDVVRTMAHKGEYRRLEAIVRASRADALRAIRWMGFEHEGTKRRFFPNGESAEVFAFTEED